MKRNRDNSLPLLLGGIAILLGILLFFLLATPKATGSSSKDAIIPLGNSQATTTQGALQSGYSPQNALHVAPGNIDNLNL